MRLHLSRLSIRRQLWALFGLFLLTGATVLVVDEIAQYRTRQSLHALKDESLLGLRRIKAVADGYSLGVVDTTFKARNYLITWNEGVASVDRARARIREHWTQLERMPHGGGVEQDLFAQLRQARVRADRAADTLRAILAKQDIQALGQFADTELYPAIDPVTSRLQTLSDLAMVRAEQVVQADITRGERVSALRIGLSLLALLAAGLIGRMVLRNAYRGVESLTWLVRRMREHDYNAQPRYRPHGEPGEVLDAFLEMRADVVKFENQLTEQLARNERTRTELARREAFQRSLLDALPTAVVAIDGEGRYFMFNNAAERLFGHRAEDFIGKDAPTLDRVGDFAPSLVTQDRYQQIIAALSAHAGKTVPPDWRAFRTAAELGLPPSETSMLHRDGHLVPVLLALAPIADEVHGGNGILGVAVDLTRIKQLEAELRASETRAQEANHAKSAFLAAMSHEIRTPMIGVTGMVEILAHTKLDPDQRRALNVIQTSAQSLLQIIGDILDFSKIEAGRLELAPSAVNLARVVQSAVANFGGSASSKGLTLTCTVDERLAPAHYADALRLRQILSNFLSNAIKFTDQGLVQAALEIKRSRVYDANNNAGPLGSDELSFRVTDTGIGVSAEAQARLFQPFAQAEGDTTRRFGGTGLGLAICRRLAELMGGAVTMESVPGLGTTMRLTVTLPRAPVEEVEAEAQGAAEITSFAPRRLPTVEEAERERSLVLLVDDHPTNRLVIARQLALAGYASEAAEDGEEGLAKWRTGRYALLLSDVHMPKLDGYQLARAIREEEAGDGRARTPIVALTAAALKGEAERCLSAGMDDYLAKPVGIPALTATLRRWLPHTIPTDPIAADSNAAAAIGQALPQLESPPPLDPTTLDMLTGGSAREARAVLDDFLASTTQDLAELVSARASGDLPALTRQAHKIKGAARIVGAVELAETAGQLEAAGRGQEWPAILPLAADLATAAERLKLYVVERYPA